MGTEIQSMRTVISAHVLMADKMSPLVMLVTRTPNYGNLVMWARSKRPASSNLMLSTLTMTASE
jgi:hypothetical protein